jgi:ADP-heptose:LPS heptosyltransferase
VPVFPDDIRVSPQEITQILVVKLDHIGDFILSLPAIRRLREIFPVSVITLLAAPASIALAHLEPAIDECISFEFFHAQSQLGERNVTASELTALAERLSTYRFDIAVDLRKHPSTRHILRYTGARLLAGYNVDGQYPWLDVSLDFCGDKPLQSKKSHMASDLINLVSAIGMACTSTWPLISAQPCPMQRTEMPDGIRHIFDRRVVAMQVGAGNLNRRWPINNLD